MLYLLLSIAFILVFLSGLILGFILAPDSIARGRVESLKVYIDEKKKPIIVNSPDVDEERENRIRTLLGVDEEIYEEDQTIE